MEEKVAEILAEMVNTGGPGWSAVVHDNNPTVVELETGEGHFTIEVAYQVEKGEPVE